VPIEGREQHLRKYFIYKEIIIMLKGKNKSLVKIAIESAFYTRRNISMYVSLHGSCNKILF
jgi:hypothetical protein